MNQTLRKTLHYISWALVLVIVILAVLLAGVRLFGLTPYTVLSGSMEPVYPVGSLIYVRAAEPESVNVGDAITFRLSGGQTVATHRVIEVDGENRQFYTKGDANDAPDGAPVPFENLIGRPILCIPRLGYLSSYISSPPGLYVAAAFAVLALLLSLLSEKGGKEKKPRKSSSEQNQIQ